MKDRNPSHAPYPEDIREWQQTFDAIPDLILVINVNNEIVMANKAVTDKFSLERNDVIGKPCHTIVHCSDKPPSFCPHARSLTTGEEQYAEVYEPCLGGYYMFSATPLFDSGGSRVGTVEVARDITARKKAEESLQDSENIFRAITESATDAIISIDSEDTIVLWNQTAEKMFGYSSGEAIGNKLTIIMPEKHKKAHRKGISTYVKTGRSRAVGKNYEVTALHKNGKEIPVELSLASWERKDDIFFTAIIRDITSRHKLEKKLREASLTDELTGLLNRRGFMTLSEKQLQISKRYRRYFSIFFIDLNEMKEINDSFGHKKGDQALIDLGGILRKTFRSSDIIARLGGDEFTVLLNEPNQGVDASITNNFLKELHAFNKQSSRPYQLSASLGISHFDPYHPKPIDELLAEADKLMYEHKSRKGQALQPEADKEEKRKASRINAGKEYKAELIVSDSSMIKNISSQGICVITPYILKKDHIYRVKIHSEKTEDVILSAVVVWSAFLSTDEDVSEDRYETGLMFIELTEERTRALEDVIANLS